MSGSNEELSINETRSFILKRAKQALKTAKEVLREKQQSKNYRWIYRRSFGGSLERRYVLKSKVRSYKNQGWKALKNIS